MSSWRCRGPVARIKDGPVGILGTVTFHAADDVQSQPGLAAAVVLALFADDVRVLARLHEHAHDGSLVEAAVVTNEKPGVRLMAVLIERLPKPGGRRFTPSV